MSDTTTDKHTISRRNLLKASAAIAPLAVSGACLIRPNAVALAEESSRALAGMSMDAAVRQESYWSEIRKAFALDDGKIHLETIIRTLLPTEVKTSINSNLQEYGIKVTRGRTDSVRAKVAKHMGCATDELALTRNATDGLTVVLGGAPLRPGDEILTSNHEHLPYYGKMLQRSITSGIQIKHVNIPIAADSKEMMLAPFMRAATSRTRLIFICHVYLTGQLFPVRELCEWARSRDIQVCVDGALAVGHVDFRIDELGCDYYSGNFHKCANGPYGTGFLYVKKDRISQLMPLFGAFDAKEYRFTYDSDNVRKFEMFGARPRPILWALEQALDFRERIGGARIEARMRYLTNLLLDEIDGHGYELMMSRNPEVSSGLISFVRPRTTLLELARFLRHKHNIRIGGAYVDNDFSDPKRPKNRHEPLLANPAVFSTRTDIERFAAALKLFAKEQA